MLFYVDCIKVSFLQVCIALHRYEEFLPKREATPDDYNNEELYMEMGKIYYAVSKGLLNCNLSPST